MHKCFGQSALGCVYRAAAFVAVVCLVASLGGMAAEVTIAAGDDVTVSSARGMGNMTVSASAESGRKEPPRDCEQQLCLAVPTFALAQQAAPSAQVMEMRTLGYYTPGDGGGARYSRAPKSTTDSRLWQLECAGDGSRWQLSETVVTPLMFGAHPDVSDISDDRSAFQKAFDCSVNLRRGIYVPPGRYWISGTVMVRPKPFPEMPPTEEEKRYQKPGPTYRFDRQAIIRAAEGFEGTAMFAFGDPDAHGVDSWDTIHRNSTLYGGLFDCNGCADVGVWLTFCNDFQVFNAEVRNFRVHAFRAGSRHAAQRSYGAVFNGCKTFRDLVPAPKGSAGIYFENCGDSHVIDCVIIGAETGIGGDDVWDCYFTNVHVWNFPDNGDLLYGFDLDGNNVLTGCQVDGPFLYAYHFKRLNNSLTGCNVAYALYGGLPNHATVNRIEPGGGVTAMNCNWNSAAPEIALKAEVEGDTSHFRSKGNKFANVTRCHVSYGPDEVCLSALVPGATVDGAIALDATRENIVNVQSVTRSGKGVYHIATDYPVPANGPLLVTPRQAASGPVLIGAERADSRTENSTVVLFHDLQGKTQDPPSFSVVMYGAGPAYTVPNTATNALPASK